LIILSQTSKYNAFLKKMLQIKVIGFKEGH